MFHQQIAQRLQSLRAEHDAGTKMLAELDDKRARLTKTMLRIEGAIQVLEELVAKSSEKDEPASAPADEPAATH